MPKFSIIVPVYNVASYLRECLDSVLAQTFTDWECLCVDDGSTDESGTILDEYAVKDSRIRVFHKPNGGVSSARNLALDNVQGEWVGFLDGDDILNKELLKIINGKIKFENCDVVKFNFQSVISKNDIEDLREPIGDAKCMVYDLSSPSGCRVAFPVFATDYIWRLYIKRSVIQCGNIRFESFSHCEDSLFNFSCFEKLTRGVQIDKALYYYRKRENSAVRSHSFAHLNSALGVVKRTVEISYEWKNFKALHSVIYKKVWQELAGHIYTLVKIANVGIVEKQKMHSSYYAMLNRLYHQKNFHPNPFMQKIYCFAGFFSWRFVSIFFLRIPLIAKGHVVKILTRIGVKK